MKNFLSILLAGVLSAGIISFAACKSDTKPENGKIPQMPAGINFTEVTDIESELYKKFSEKFEKSHALKIDSYEHSTWTPTYSNADIYETENVRNIKILQNSENSHALKLDNWENTNKELGCSANENWIWSTNEKQTYFYKDNIFEGVAESLWKDSGGIPYRPEPIEIKTPKHLINYRDDLNNKNLSAARLAEDITWYADTALSEENNFYAECKPESERFNIFTDQYWKTHANDGNPPDFSDGEGYWTISGKVYVSDDGTKMYAEINEKADFIFKSIDFGEKKDAVKIQYIDLAADIKENDFPETLFDEEVLENSLYYGTDFSWVIDNIKSGKESVITPIGNNANNLTITCRLEGDGLCNENYLNIYRFETDNFSDGITVKNDGTIIVAADFIERVKRYAEEFLKNEENFKAEEFVLHTLKISLTVLNRGALIDETIYL